MRTVLKLLVTLFTAFTLQRILLAPAAFLILLPLVAPGPVSGAFAILACATVLLGPAMIGGTAHRMLADRAALRPHGQRMVLVAAGLAVLGMAALAAITTYILVISGALPGTGMPAPDPLLIGVRVWTGIGAMWLVTFAATGTRFGVLVRVAAFLAVGHPSWASVAPLAPSAAVVLVGWVVLAFRYRREVPRRGLRAGTRTQPDIESMGIIDRLLPLRGTKDSLDSAKRAFLLGSPSAMTYAGIAAVVGIVVAGWTFSGATSPDSGGARQINLGIVALLPAVLSVTLVRRARALWLRAGVGRAGIFRICERQAALNSAWALLGATAGRALALTVIKPGSALYIIPGMLPTLANSVFALYFGLCLTSNDRDINILATIVVTIGWIVQLIALGPPDFAQPPPMRAMAVAGGTLVAALLLRQLALHRWQSLDWHLTRPPRAVARSA